MRGLLLLLHAASSLVALLWFLRSRGTAVLVFTHEPDIDEEGVDVQMGPLVDELARRGRLVEITLVPLTLASWRGNRAKGRPFVSHACLLAAARALGLLRGGDAARLTVSRTLLRALRPRVLYLIDESGSGQMLLRGARCLGIPVVGIQHGDFQPTNLQYARPDPAVEPADALCVWSPWFRERLLQVSPIYDAEHVHVTGRMRTPPPAVARREDDVVRVLFLGERDAAFAVAAEPFLEAVRSRADMELSLRTHPNERRGPGKATSAPGGLARAVLAVDVVLGSGSSALLEALFLGRPAVVLLTSPSADPARHVAQGLLPGCADPARLPELCRSAISAGVEKVRERVWGGAPDHAVASLLALGDSLHPPGNSN